MSLQTDVNNEFIKYLSSITNEKGKRAFTGRDLNKLMRWEAQDPRFEGLLEHTANSIDNYQEAVEFKKDLQSYFTKPTIFTADQEGNLIVLARNIPAGQEDFANKSYNIHDIRLAPGLIREESLADVVADIFTVKNLTRDLTLRNLGRVAGYAALFTLFGLAGCASVQADDYNSGGAPGQNPTPDDSIQKLPQKTAPQMNNSGIISRHAPSKIRFNNFMAFDLEFAHMKHTPSALLHELPSANLTWYQPIRLTEAMDFLLKTELNAAFLGTMYNNGERKALGEFKVMDDGSLDISLGYNLARLSSWKNQTLDNNILPQNMFTLGLHARGRHVDLSDSNVKKEQQLEFGLESVVLYGPFQMHLTTNHSWGNMSQREMKKGYTSRDRANNSGRVEISYNLPIGVDIMAHLAGGKVERDVKGPNNFTAREMEEFIDMGGAVILPNRNGQYAGLVFGYRPWQRFETDKPNPGETGRTESSHGYLGLTAGTSLGGLLRNFGANIPRNSILNDLYLDMQATYGHHSNLPHHTLDINTGVTLRF